MRVCVFVCPQARVDPDQFGVSFCSIDGQRHAIGDSKTEFCIQSCCKPINYAIALEKHGHHVVDRHVGSEPSGRQFNAMSLNEHPKLPATTAVPHNPCINAGAIMTCALLNGDSVEARLNEVKAVWSQLGGTPNETTTHDEEVAMGESLTANRNRCLAYMMAEEKALPEKTNIDETLEFYFRACSIQQDAEKMSVVAATLANGGVCPVTNERVFKEQTVREVLSVMFTCGMYDYSGEFSYRMGFPAKSGKFVSVCVCVLVRVNMSWYHFWFLLLP